MNLLSRVVIGVGMAIAVIFVIGRLGAQQGDTPVQTYDMHEMVIIGDAPHPAEGGGAAGESEGQAPEGEGAAGESEGPAPEGGEDAAAAAAAARRRARAQAILNEYVDKQVRYMTPPPGAPRVNDVPEETLDQILERELGETPRRCFGCRNTAPERVMEENPDRTLPGDVGHDSRWLQTVSPAEQEGENGLNEEPGEIGEPIKKKSGEPVILESGDFLYEMPLGVMNDPVWGELPVTATYRTGRTRGEAGMAGLGVSHTFGERIIERGDESSDDHTIVYHRGDGAIVSFALSPEEEADDLGSDAPTAAELNALFRFCRLDRVGEPIMQDSGYEQVMYYEKGGALTLMKKRATIGYRTPGNPCFGTRKFQYTVINPTGGKLTFEGIVQSPDNYREWGSCAVEKHQHHPGLYEQLGGANGQRFDYRCQTRGIPPSMAAPEPRTTCSSGRYENWRRLMEDLYHNVEQVVSVGDCVARSEGHEMLRSRRDFVPLGIILQVDHYRPARLWTGDVMDPAEHPWARRISLDSSKIDLGGIGADSVDMYWWLVGGLEHSQTVNGTALRDHTIRVYGTYGDPEVLDWGDLRLHVRGDFGLDRISYNRSIDASLLNWMSGGVVAPLVKIIDPRYGELNVEYTVFYQDDVQFLDYAQVVRGFRCLDGTQFGTACDPADPGCRRRTVRCGRSLQEGAEIDAAENPYQERYQLDPEMERWIGISTRFEREVKRLTTALPDSMVIIVKRGGNEVISMYSSFSLYRDELLEERADAGSNGFGAADPIRNPNGYYLPYREVFISQPVLTSVMQPGHSTTVLNYAAPSGSGNCPIDMNNIVSDAFDTYGIVFPERPSSGRMFERGYTIDPSPSPTWSDCDNLMYGRRRLEDRWVNYNGPLVLHSVNYNINGALSRQFVYSLRPNNGNERYPWVHERIRMSDVMENDGIFIHNEYDRDGRVTQHFLPDGTITYAYRPDFPRRGLHSTAVTTRGGAVATFIYNRDNLLQSRAEGDGTIYRFEYASPAEGKPAWWGSGRLAREVLPSGQSIEYAYDDDAQYAEVYLPESMTVHAAGRSKEAAQTSYAYEGMYNKVSSMTYPVPSGNRERAAVHYRYDYQEPGLNPCNRESPQGNLVWANYPDGTFEAWTHNKQGKVLEHRHRNGQVDRYDYVPFADDGLNCAIYDVLRGYRP